MKLRYITISLVLIAAGFSLWYFGPARARVTYLYNLRGGEDSGLVGYWPLDNGRADDLSKNHNDGTLTNGPVAATGKVNGALSFDGVDDLVSITDSDSLSALNNITVSAWIMITGNPGPAGNGGGIATKRGTSGNFEWQFLKGADSTDTINFTVFNNGSGSSPQGVTSSTAVPRNEWHHVAATFDASVDTAVVYIDGVLDASNAAITNTLANGNAPVQIGKVDGNPAFDLGYFNGSIDDVRIYNRALSANEIKEYYDATSAGHFVDSAPTLVNTTDSVNLQSGLVGHWSMDGNNIDWATGNVADSSGQGNNGTQTNMSTSTSPTAGVIGQALNFDGVDDSVSVPNDASLDVHSANFSMSAWVKFNDSGTTRYILQKGANATSYYQIRRLPTNKIRVVVSDSSDTNFDFYDTITTFPASSSFYNIAATWNKAGRTWKVYINGVEDGQTTTSSGVTPSVIGTTGLFIGDEPSHSNSFNGTIDDVRIYNRALTASEVKQLYNSTKILVNTTPKNVLTTGLVGHWTFDGPDMLQNVADSSGQGNTGHMTNFAATSTAVRAGVHGQALRFDGVDDYVNAPNASVFDFTVNDEFTLTAWANTDTTNVNQTIVGVWGDGIGSNKEFVLQNSRAVFYDGTTNQSVSKASGAQTGWHYYTVTFSKSSGNLTYYTDGVQDGQTTGLTSSDVQYNSSLTLDIAQLGDGSQKLTGSIDDVRIYNRALTKFEIKQLYKMGR